MKKQHHTTASHPAISEFLEQQQKLKREAEHRLKLQEQLKTVKASVIYPK